MRADQGRGAFWGALVVAWCLSSVCLYGQTTATKRGVQDASSPATSGVQPGPYYALVIGNKNYLHLPKLQTPIDDAKAIAQLLHDVFGFQTKVLLDADRNQIMTALVEYRRTLPEDSNLLIYYAGHGHHDRDTDEAYWLPVDAQADNNANWVSADDVTRDVRAMRSVQHILVISDSCYSGYMIRDRDPHAAIEPSERGALLAKMQKSKSRNLMSSGGDEPVADAGAPGHSIFAWAVLQSLRQIDEDQFTASYVFYSFIQPKVGGRSDQLPQYSWIRNSDHDAGDFVFFRQPVAKVGGAPAITPRPTTTPPPANLSALPAGMDPTMADLYSRAKAGNSQAMYELGWDYQNGKGVPKDYQQAVAWYRKAAEAGNALGMTNLGHMYEDGYGVDQDYKQALTWYRKAAEAGDTRGMNNLGWMYHLGRGVDKDEKQAFTWIRKAAEAGDTLGMDNLGAMYANGWGVEQDYQQAMIWDRKAAEGGIPDAMYGLGYGYETGHGLGKDLQQAVTWYRQAAQLGNQQAKDALKRLGESP